MTDVNVDGFGVAKTAVDGATRVVVQDDAGSGHAALAAFQAWIMGGLGNSATRNVGTTPGTVAAGNDSRFSTAATLLPIVAPFGYTGNAADIICGGPGSDDLADWNTLADLASPRATHAIGSVFVLPGEYFAGATPAWWRTGLTFIPVGRVVINSDHQSSRGAFMLDSGNEHAIHIPQGFYFDGAFAAGVDQTNQFPGCGYGVCFDYRDHRDPQVAADYGGAVAASGPKSTNRAGNAGLPAGKAVNFTAATATSLTKTAHGLIIGVPLPCTFFGVGTLLPAPSQTTTYYALPIDVDHVEFYTSAALTTRLSFTAGAITGTCQVKLGWIYGIGVGTAADWNGATWIVSKFQTGSTGLNRMTVEGAWFTGGKYTSNPVGPVLTDYDRKWIYLANNSTGGGVVPASNGWVVHATAVGAADGIAVHVDGCADGYLDADIGSSGTWGVQLDCGGWSYGGKVYFGKQGGWNVVGRSNVARDGTEAQDCLGIGIWVHAADSVLGVLKIDSCETAIRVESSRVTIAKGSRAFNRSTGGLDSNGYSMHTGLSMAASRTEMDVHLDIADPQAKELTITACTSGSPGVLTSTAHGLGIGEQIPCVVRAKAGLTDSPALTVTPDVDDLSPVIYWLVPTTANAVAVYPTKADAVAGTNAVTFVTNGAVTGTRLGVGMQNPFVLDSVTTMPTGSISVQCPDANGKTRLIKYGIGRYSPTPIKTASTSAKPGDLIPVSTASAAVTITLPTAPFDEALVGVEHVIQASARLVTVLAGGTDLIGFAGGPASITLNLAERVKLMYEADTTGVGTGVWHKV